MSWGNPHENDPDFKFLAIDPKLMLEEAAKHFDAKTSTWVPDHKEGYVKATITATKGDDVTVNTETNEVKNRLIKRLLDVMLPLTK